MIVKLSITCRRDGLLEETTFYWIECVEFAPDSHDDATNKNQYSDVEDLYLMANQSAVTKVPTRRTNNSSKYWVMSSRVFTI